MKISEQKQNKISEQILSLLFQENPKPLFTSYIARELARDEEFIKKLLFNLKEKKFVIAIKKNQKGIDYVRRIRWKLSSQAYKAYSQHQ